ncbi:MAG: glycerophosphodiester phosphodiesterase family protein [Candidatus Hydrogenedentes bacterium]|nr:glycerophosphodiester phosphodiesterase family protein [Candidatus Hydrogenedentota bacterium]
MIAFRLNFLILLALAMCLPALGGVLPAPKHGGVYVMAHRGAHVGIPENTLAAYQKAIDLGADYVEIDLRTTKDGELVSVHNADVDHYTQGAVKGKVRDHTLAELKAMDIGSRVGAEWANERIPTFDEILTLCKGKIGIYLDFKDAGVTQTLGVIRKHQMEKDILWYASFKALEQVQAECAECIIMPDPGPAKNLPKLFERFPGVPVVASVWKFYSQEFLKQCQDAGAAVIVDESDPSCWADALTWGTDGIQTDDPEGLIRFLDAQGATQPAAK